MASLAHLPAESRLDAERALLERLRRDAVPAVATASAIEVFCEASAGLLTDARAVLEQEALAWLVLCDRGWPPECRPDPPVLAAAGAWMAVWRDVVAAPMVISGASERGAERERRAALAHAEQGLARVLPASVWQLVTPLDATGRATLACLLQALGAWATARARALLAAQRTVHVRERVAVLAADVQGLGHAAPADLLDLDAWRRVATALLRNEHPGARQLTRGNGQGNP